MELKTGTIMFGGSFDPVHFGHLIMCRAVAEAVGASRVLLVPTSANPLKNPPLATNAQRLEMLRLATAGDDLFEISDIELNREPPSYSYNTVEALAGQFEGRFAMVVGADMIADLSRWYRVDDLLSKADLIIACRPPSNADDIRNQIENLSGQLAAEHIERLTQLVVETPLVDISSTQIRDRIKAGKSVKYLLPQTVADYIKREKIYS